MSDAIFGKLGGLEAELDDAVAKTEREARKLDAETERQIGNMQRVEGDIRASTGMGFGDFAGQLRQAAEAHKRALEAQLAATLAGIREGAEAVLSETERAIEAAYHAELGKVGPQGQEWAEAEARREFVKEDVAALTPAEILERYRAAETAGDRVTAWLLARYGLKELETRSFENTKGGMEARRALAELRQARYGAIEARRNERLDRLERYRAAMKKPRGAVEEAEYRQTIRLRFGLQG
ncbi:MAG: hypothetical protein ACOYZ7_20445 [Chloroflexota bacterium]